MPVHARSGHGAPHAAEGSRRTTLCGALGEASAFPSPAASRAAVTRRTHCEDGVTDRRSLVTVVDDSVSVRESLPDLLRQSGFDVEAFGLAEAFLESEALDRTSCLILDVGLPGMSGPDLQLELTRRRLTVPIVFITAQGDASLRPRLLARGAVACLFKPFSDTALLDALAVALK